MAYEFKLPDVGEGIHEGEIVKFHVKEGDTIQEDDVLAEVQTDKAVVEIPVPVSGTVTKLNAKEGEILEVGSVLAVFDTGKEEAAEPAESQSEEKAAPRGEGATSSSKTGRCRR